MTLKSSHESWTQDVHKFWYRDPVEVARILFGNPLFKNEMVFTAENHMNVQEGRMYSEIHWSDWWWELQVSIIPLFREFL